MKRKKVLFLQFTVSNPASDVEYWTSRKANPFTFFYAEPGVAWVAEAISDIAEAKVIDCDFFSDEEILSAIARFHPEIVGFSCFTAGWPKAERIAIQIDQNAVKVFGGWHVSLPGMAERILSRFPEGVVITGKGEGVQIIFKEPRSYVGKIINGNDYPRERRYPFSVQLRNQPFFTMFGVPEKQCTATIVLRGGCTLSCDYCSSRKSGLAKERTVEEVIKEIARLSNKGVNFIFIRDENPFLPQYREWLERFRDILCQTGLNKKVKFHSFGDTRFTDRLFVKEVLVKAGWTGVDVGVEHVTTEGREALGRKQDWTTTVEAFKAIREAGLFITANIMLWSPGDTLETFDQTLKGLKELQPDELYLMFFVPMPGLADGKFDVLSRREDRIEEYHFLSPILLNGSEILTEELIKRRWLLMRDYYTSSGYAGLMRFRRQQFGEREFQRLTSIRRQRFLKYGIDIWIL